jgi:hypothetical protein
MLGVVGVAVALVVVVVQGINSRENLIFAIE